MSRRIRGVKSLTTELQITTHPTDGDTSSITIEGEAAQVAGQIAAWKATGAQTRYVQREGFGRLDITYANQQAAGTPELPVYQWEFDQNEFQRDLFEHPLAANFTDDQIANLKNLLSNPDADRSFSTPEEQAFFNRYSRQRTTYFPGGGAPVLRKVMTVSNSYQITDAFLGVGQIWNAGDIVHFERGIIFNWMADLITGFQRAYDFGQIEAFDPEVEVFGWLKKAPTIGQRWGQRVELNQEWWGALWKLDGFSSFF